MHRRQFTRTSLALAGAATAGTILTSSISAQTPDASPAASPASTPGVWESAEDNVTVEYDHEIFGNATTSGVTGEWCVLRVPDIDRFLSFIIKLEDKYPTSEEELRDYVENSDELEVTDEEVEIERLTTTEGNGAFGLLYTAPTDAAPDNWNYSEFIPAVAGEHRTIQCWINSRRSKLDRELVTSAISSVMINGEPAIRAIEIEELMNQVEAIEVAE